MGKEGKLKKIAILLWARSAVFILPILHAIPAQAEIFASELLSINQESQEANNVLQDSMDISYEITSNMWLDAWKAIEESDAEDSGTLPSSSSDYDDYETPWTVTAAVAPFGQQTLKGESACIETTSNNTTKPTDAILDGVNCWCRMTSPRVGSWVFNYTNSTASACASGCANDCSNCVQLGTTGWCSRRAVLD